VVIDQVEVVKFLDAADRVDDNYAAENRESGSPTRLAYKSRTQ